MNRRAFVATTVATALPWSTALAVALDPMATVLSPDTLVVAKFVKTHTSKEQFVQCWQCSLEYLRQVGKQVLDDGWELAYLEIKDNG